MSWYFGSCTTRVRVIVGAGLVGASLPVALTAQEPTEKVQYLLVQTAGGASFEDGVLILESIGTSTLYFSDRPERVAGYILTEEFVANWASGDDSFASDPPNADLSIVSDDGAMEIVLVLMNPRLVDDDLSYDVEILEGEMPAAAGPNTLFIDIIGRPLSPVSVAGVDRRVTRRTVRRLAY